MKSSIIRNKFIEFFKKHDHKLVASSPVIPAEDPTLLFTNAGMNQFKDLFLGKEQRSYNKAVSIQKCIRAGGKHNDLENVGFTKRHLTFFEMMGNFSFGAYFKKEAIEYAWNFLTEDIKLPKENLYISIYLEDDEAFELWNKTIGIPKEKIYRLGKKENFWQMGDTGPCGPCTEIHVDRGPAFGCKDIAKCGPACDCDRFLEIWNLVFMQFNQNSDGSLTPLKQKGVDTGMGFERIASVVQNKDNVFETDVFEPIMKGIEELTGHKYATAKTEIKTAFNVLADHIRSTSFAIADGGIPSNEGRGYVLRKIIRRAALFSQKLSNEPIFHRLAGYLIGEMGNIYPELKENQSLIERTLKLEIERFSENLVRGQAILEKMFQDAQKTKTLTGEDAFKLYDTYGFPVELTVLIAGEHGYKVDMPGFEVEMEKQRLLSGKKMKESSEFNLTESISTEYCGDEHQELEANVIAILQDGNSVKTIEAGKEVFIITDKSPFYVEKGGQISDKGWAKIKDKKTEVVELKNIENGIAIKITAPVKFSVGDTIVLAVDTDIKNQVKKNHTATHLLQAALVELFGKQIKQAGSEVTAANLRFDFNYHENLTAEQIKAVETLVNQKIMENIPLCIEETTLKIAQNRGVTAFFGDKYNPECVRVVEVPGFSAELCGGSHVEETGDIGCFKIIEMTSLSAGVRRIIAITGSKALELFQENFATVKALGQMFKVQLHEVLHTVEKQSEQLRDANYQIKNLKKQMWKNSINTWSEQVNTTSSIPTLALLLELFDNDELKEITNELNTKKAGLYLLISNTGKASSFYCAIDKSLINKINLKNFAEWLREEASLRGGGKDLVLQGGGPIITKQILEKIQNKVKTL
ncbi:MAG: Alanine-tRNA ligase [candidate division TM6 bacterium GW2011_GWF2_32_72]|nr:MAG: Alanine-tRNA ligase [candidate division TM6 bacterium GW2011_GWF2_32_72]